MDQMESESETNRMRRGICITQRDAQGKPLVVLTKYDDGMRHDMSAEEYAHLGLRPHLGDLRDCTKRPSPESES
jgi:hypothetical protein